MNWKKSIFFVVFLVVAIFYFDFFQKDKSLKFIPQNADVVILVDTKKATRQYISAWIAHPSQWFKSKKSNTISVKNSGVKIPDFLQIFHIKDSRFTDWYSILELKDKQRFLSFLKQEQFAKIEENIFQKDNFFVKIENENCIVGTSKTAFENFSRLFFPFSQRTNFSADEFIDHSLGSISFISGGKKENFSIDLNDNDIEIRKGTQSLNFNSVLEKLEKKAKFLEVELDAQNIKNYTQFFDETIADNAEISYLKATADLEMVQDTIVKFEYDDNFNEIEKKSIQKIIQPNYFISLQSLNVGKTAQYFQQKKWINAQNQFTVIPFQLNIISTLKNGFEIKSTRNPIHLSQQLNENYIFVRNNALLLSSLSSLSAAEKKIISSIEYVFYGNKGQDFYFKIKRKKEELPLILR